MSNMKEIKNALKDTLLAYFPLKEFIRSNIFDGLREGIVDFPCLVIEPLVKDEEDDTYAQQRLSAKFGVMGFIKTMQKDSQLDEIFDFENLVLKALGQDRRLCEKAEFVKVIQTSYDSELWPIRNFSIQIEIEFRQNSAIR